MPRYHSNALLKRAQGSTDPKVRDAAYALVKLRADVRLGNVAYSYDAESKASDELEAALASASEVSSEGADRALTLARWIS